MKKALLATFLVLSAAVGMAADGWITTCGYSHSNNDDPIVFPNQPGVSHLHDFIGARTTDAGSTVASLQAGGTTCVMPDDTSAYWTPALYKNNGVTRVLPSFSNSTKVGLFYYRQVPGTPNTAIQPFPPGLKMIVGNSKATSPSDNPWIGNGRIYFKCGPGSGAHLQAPPAQCSSGVMVLVFMFPQWWDGVNLDSPDHISHMSYIKTATHSVQLPRIEAFVRYVVGTAPIGTVVLSSGPYYTAHADFFNAWDAAGLQGFIDQCMINGSCGTNP